MSFEKKIYEGGPLAENEYLLKIRKSDNCGFLTKLNKTGAIPKPFLEWGGDYYGKSSSDMPIYVFTEEYREGWKLEDWRFGQSQNWATLMHPCGFTLEVYLHEFLRTIQNNVMDKGTLQGSFKWEKNVLIRK